MSGRARVSRQLPAAGVPCTDARPDDGGRRASTVGCRRVEAGLSVPGCQRPPSPESASGWRCCRGSPAGAASGQVTRTAPGVVAGPAAAFDYDALCDAVDTGHLLAAHPARQLGGGVGRQSTTRVLTCDLTGASAPRAGDAPHPSGFDQTGPDGVAGELRTVPQLEFLQDVGPVSLDGLDADHQEVRDLPGRAPLGDELDDLGLTRREDAGASTCVARSVPALP